MPHASPLPPELLAPVMAPVAAIDAALAQALDGAPRHRPRSLTDAIRYSLLAPGKRIRPLLAWHACVAVGGHGEDSLAAGVALELVHAFSLVHDDLPALDNDDLRRGRPTLHKHAGEAMAILAGDAMLSLAFDHLLAQSRFSESLRVALCRQLSNATDRMISGQIYDTLGDEPGGLDPALAPRDALRLIHEHKTGALIAAACRMGALSGLPDVSTPTAARALGAISDSGTALGLAFQIVDDLLDVEQHATHVGKRTQKDHHAGKRTYPGLLGVEEARRAAHELQDQAQAALVPLGEKARSLGLLAEYMTRRTR